MAGKYIFPCPILKSFHIIKSSKKKKKSVLSFLYETTVPMSSNTWSYFFLEWTFEEGIMLLWDEILKKL